MMHELLLLLLLTGSPSPTSDLKEVEFRVVKSDNIPPALLTWLALDPRTSGEILVRLFDEPDPFLRRIIIKNPNCPGEIHAKFMVDYWDDAINPSC